MDTLLFTYWSWSTLVIRVVLGVIFFAHGAQKVLGWFGGYGLKGTTQYLASTGIPLPVAYLVCFFEFLGGIDEVNDESRDEDFTEVLARAEVLKPEKTEKPAARKPQAPVKEEKSE